jgi:hypothetical protein
MVFIFSGCSKSEKSEEASKSNSQPAYSPNSDAKPVDPATAGVITGIVKLDGTPPKMRNINMRSVPSCAQIHEETPATLEDVVPGDNGTLQNVVVYLKGDFNAYTFPQPGEVVSMDQKGCMYVPHVVAVRTQQPLGIHNSDSTSHNSNTLTKDNMPWNQTQSVGAAPVEHSFSHPEVAIGLKCNIHPWMKAYVAVLDNPYFQVTGADGSFTLKNVPPGSYTLTAWHERYGTSEQMIQVTPKAEQKVTITYKAG